MLSPAPRWALLPVLCRVQAKCCAININCPLWSANTCHSVCVISLMSDVIRSALSTRNSEGLQLQKCDLSWNILYFIYKLCLCLKINVFNRESDGDCELCYRNPSKGQYLFLSTLTYSLNRNIFPITVTLICLWNPANWHAEFETLCWVVWLVPGTKPQF